MFYLFGEHKCAALAKGTHTVVMKWHASRNYVRTNRVRKGQPCVFDCMTDVCLLALDTLTFVSVHTRNYHQSEEMTLTKA